MICVNAFILFYSSVSSMINSLAAVLWTDFLKLKFGHLSENKATIINKILGKMHLGYINNMYIPYMQFIVELTKTYVILKHNFSLCLWLPWDRTWYCCFKASRDSFTGQ